MTKVAAKASKSKARPASTSLPTLLDGASDRRFRELIQAIFGVSARMIALRERIGAVAGLTGPQYAILLSIGHFTGEGDGVSVNALAAHLYVSGTYVTAESKKLQAQGLVQRVPNPRDRRSVLLRLDAKGQALLADVLPAVRAINDTLFADLSRAGFEILHEALTGLVHAADEAILVAERERRQRRRA